MLNHLLDRIVCDTEENFWVKIAPLIVFGFIWLFSMISKAAQSKAGKTEEQQPQTRPPKPRQRQPNLDDFIKMVKNRYAEAKEQAMRSAEEGIYRPQETLPPRETLPPKPAPVPQRPSAAQPAMKSQVSQSYISPKISLELKTPEPVLPQVKELPTSPAPGLPDLSQQIEKVDEIPVEMTALDPHIYELSHKPYLPELMEQLTNPDGLRKAILYSEIFGKPLALRD
jgi:hypothetical protein